MNLLKATTFFLSSILQVGKWSEQGRPILMGRETEGAVKNISGETMKVCNGGSLAAVRKYQK